MLEKTHCFIWPVYRGLVGCVLFALSNSLWAQLPAEVLERLSAFLPGINATMVELSAFPGAYQIKYGLDVYYVSADGGYLMAGNLIDLSTGRNLTEESRKSARLEVIDQIDPQPTAPCNRQYARFPLMRQTENRITRTASIDIRHSGGIDSDRHVLPRDPQTVPKDAPRQHPAHQEAPCGGV